MAWYRSVLRQNLSIGFGGGAANVLQVQKSASSGVRFLPVDRQGLYSFFGVCSQGRLEDDVTAVHPSSAESLVGEVPVAESVEELAPVGIDVVDEGLIDISWLSVSVKEVKS